MCVEGRGQPLVYCVCYERFCVRYINSKLTHNNNCKKFILGIALEFQFITVTLTVVFDIKTREANYTSKVYFDMLNVSYVLYLLPPPFP